MVGREKQNKRKGMKEEKKYSYLVRVSDNNTIILTSVHNFNNFMEEIYKANRKNKYLMAGTTAINPKYIVMVHNETKEN